MMVQIELLDLHKEYNDVMKWVSIRSKVKNAMFEMKNKEARDKAIEVFDKLEEICDLMEADLVEHDKDFERKLKEEFGK